MKLCDFGFTEPLSTPININKGTDGYKAPEIYQSHNRPFQGDKADIFALGVMLFIISFGVPPFTVAEKDNAYYRFFYKGPEASKFFFKLHPATRSLY